MELDMRGALNLYSVASKILCEKAVILATARKKFEEENADLIESMGSLDVDVQNAKAIVKEKAEAEYQETGEKKLLGGIGIRILKKINYDSGEAMIWAEENMPIAVKQVLDKRQFETFAKSNDLDFVTKEESVSVTFPKEIVL